MNKIEPQMRYLAIMSIGAAITGIAGITIAATSLRSIDAVRHDLAMLSAQVGALTERTARQTHNTQARGASPQSRRVPVESLIAKPDGSRASALPGTRPNTLEARQKSAQWLAEARQEFANEPRDPDWAATMETGLVEAAGHEDVADVIDAMQDFKAECRSRRCFIEARFANRGAATDWLDVFVLQAGSITRSTTSTVVNPDGSTTVYIFGGKG